VLPSSWWTALHILLKPRLANSLARRCLKSLQHMCHRSSVQVFVHTQFVIPPPMNRHASGVAPMCIQVHGTNANA
jgi:hypothetical protein